VKPAANPRPEPVGEEHWARKGDVRLHLWRKRCAPAPGRAALVLVHGSSLSALPSFDLTVPGHPDYSMMDWFARAGFDVWTLDHEGYGRSTITAGNADIACGIEDLRAAVPVILAQTGAERLSLYGISSGSLRAGGYAAAEPHRVAHLVLDAFVWTGRDSPTLSKRKEGLEFFRTHARRPIDRAFITGIFTRDKEGTTESAVAQACADAQLAYGDSVPTGTYLDMTQNLPLVDPRKITAPTLIVRGEHDGIATMEDLLEFYRLLPGNDKQIAVLPDLAHSSQLGVYRHRMWRTMEAFLTRDG
jgi:pimeloyl-ACP methyl ester carboxylesterase